MLLEKPEYQADLTQRERALLDALFPFARARSMDGVVSNFRFVFPGPSGEALDDAATYALRVFCKATGLDAKDYLPVPRAALLLQPTQQED